MAPDNAGPRSGCLYLVGTPIGNLQDITLRAIEVLRSVDLIAAEDTRAAKTLLDRHGIATRTLSLFEGNERARTSTLLQRLQSGQQVAIISRAGMPVISDPGYPLLRACVEQGIAVDVIPGPSAVTTALLLSGFSAAGFRFVGFLPRRGTARRRALTSIANTHETVVLFESPQRIVATLQELAAVLGPRPVAVVREMTKMHQEVQRGLPAELAARLDDHPPRGEVTLVVSAALLDEEALHEGMEAQVSDMLAAGQSPRQIADGLGQLGCPRREVYQLALQLADKSRDPKRRI